MADMIFAERLRSLRKEKGITQEELAGQILASKQAVSNYENGREPPFYMLRGLATFFGVTVDYLVGFSDVAKPENAHIGERTGLTDKAIYNLESIWERQKIIHGFRRDFPARNDIWDVQAHEVLQKLLEEEDEYSYDDRRESVGEHFFKRIAYLWDRYRANENRTTKLDGVFISPDGNDLYFEDSDEYKALDQVTKEQLIPMPTSDYYVKSAEEKILLSLRRIYDNHIRNEYDSIPSSITFPVTEDE